MLDLGGIGVEEVATALADQTDSEHRWLLAADGAARVLDQRHAR